MALDCLVDTTKDYGINMKIDNDCINYESFVHKMYSDNCVERASYGWPIMTEQKYRDLYENFLIDNYNEQRMRKLNE
jgi:hypothetical protein